MFDQMAHSLLDQILDTGLGLSKKLESMIYPLSLNTSRKGLESSLLTLDILKELEPVRSIFLSGPSSQNTDTLHDDDVVVFLALSKGMRPDLGNKLSCFIALGPAVYAGPVFKTFPFSLMRKFKARGMWSFVFGGSFIVSSRILDEFCYSSGQSQRTVREFFPIISILQGTLPSWLFGHTAFPVFAFIFGFTDAVRPSPSFPPFPHINVPSRPLKFSNG